MNWAIGLNISNIGAKVSYTETIDKDFIPTNLRIGSSLSTELMIIINSPLNLMLISY